MGCASGHSCVSSRPRLACLGSARGWRTLACGPLNLVTDFIVPTGMRRTSRGSNSCRRSPRLLAQPRGATRAALRHNRPAGLAEKIGNGHELVALGLVAAQQPIRSCHRVRAVQTKLLVAAVVEQDDIAAVDLPCDSLFDRIR
jgi:hypothetical protein